MIKQQLAAGVARKRVGFITSGAPARGHSKLLTADGKQVGEVTSGGFSPCLQKNIAMGAPPRDTRTHPSTPTHPPAPCVPRCLAWRIGRQGRAQRA